MFVLFSTTHELGRESFNPKTLIDAIEVVDKKGYVSEFYITPEANYELDNGLPLRRAKIAPGLELLGLGRRCQDDSWKADGWLVNRLSDTQELTFSRQVIIEEHVERSIFGGVGGVAKECIFSLAELKTVFDDFLTQPYSCPNGHWIPFNQAFLTYTEFLKNQ